MTADTFGLSQGISKRPGEKLKWGLFLITRKARTKGTCSVTNFNVTEVQYAAIRDGRKVEWYVYEVPLAKTMINVWGEEVEYNSKTYYKYESALCEKYKSLTGHYPLLSSNSGVE